MANPIVQAFYDLKDGISSKLSKINDALRGNAKEAANTASASERSNQRMSDSYKKTADSIGQLRTALAAIGAFVGLDKLKDGIEEVLKAGEDLDDLQKRVATAFGGIEQGAQAFDQVRELAKGVPQSFEDVSDAAIALKKAGFDPLDGSLQALLDNANATNQSQEQLIATIDALGKANIKGAVNIKALVSLTEAGIPVFDLLGKAMGVSADRVRQLAESGQLGSDSIKLIVTQLGKLRAGASTAELGDLDSQLTKLKDVGREFLETIANSGALDYFRKQLADLTSQAEAAAKSGKLQEIAKSISDGIVNGAKAIGAAGKFLLDHASAVTTVAKAYAALKISGVALDLAKVAIGFQDTGKAAGTAAAGADKVAKSVRGIPTNVRIALALVGFDVAVATGEELAKLYLTLNDSTLKNDEAQRKIGDEIQANAVHFAEVAASLAKYRDQQVLSAAAAATLSDEEREGYATRLAGLTKYLTAQVLYLTNLDRAGLADKAQLEQLAQLKVQLDAAKKGQDALAQGVAAVADAVTTKLTPAAQLLANHLAEIKDDSKAVGEEIQKTFDGLDLKRNISAVGDFATAFDTVAAKGGKAADTLNSTLLKSLKDLSGEDLLQFQTGASFAIGQLGEDAERTSSVIKDTLEVALDDLGATVGVADGQVTKAGANMVATFKTVADNAQASSVTIADAFTRAVGKVQTVAEANSLGEAFESAFSRGKVSAEDFNDTIIELDERVRTLTSTMNPLQSQFDLLGIKSQAQLNALRDNAKEAFDAIVNGARAGVNAQEDVQRAFEAYGKTVLDSVKDSEQWKQDTARDQLEVIASTNSLSDAFLDVGQKGKKAGKDMEDGLNDAKHAADETKDSIDQIGNSLNHIGHETGDEFSKRVDGWADSLAAAATAAASADAGIRILTADQLRAFTEISQEFNSGAITFQQYQDKISDALNNTTIELDKQIEALRKFNDEVADLQSQIAGANGDDVTVENIRHEKKIQDLKDENDLTLAQRRKLEDLENQLHEANLKRIKQENDARNNRGPTPAPAPAPAPTGDAPAPQPTERRGSAVTGVTVDFSGATIFGGTKDELARSITRLIKPQLDAIAARSR